MAEVPEEVYRACAEASWDAGAQRLWHPENKETYVELMLSRPDWRALVDTAYRAGQPAALRAAADDYEADWRRGMPVGTATPGYVADAVVFLRRRADALERREGVVRQDQKRNEETL